MVHHGSPCVANAAPRTNRKLWTLTTWLIWQYNIWLVCLNAKEGSSNHRFHQVLPHFQSALYQICKINPKDPGNISSGTTGKNVTLQFLNLPTNMAMAPKAALRLLLQLGRRGFPKAYIQRCRRYQRCIINESWAYSILTFRILMLMTICVCYLCKRVSIQKCERKKNVVSGFHRCCIRVFRHLTSTRASAWRKLNILWRCEIAKLGSKLYRMRAKQQFRVTTVFPSWNCSFKYTGEITEHHMAEWGKNKDPPNIQSILLLWHIMDALRGVHQFASRIAPCLYETCGMRCVVTGRERHDSFFS